MIHTLRRANRGTAVVEFALVAPVFIFLALGTLEFGRVMYQYNTLTKSVRDGAQYLARNCINAASQCVPTTAQTTTAKNLVVYGNVGGTGSPLLTGMTTTNVTITTTPVTNPAYVTVTATYTYTSILAGGIIRMAGGGTMTAPNAFTASVKMVGL